MKPGERCEYMKPYAKPPFAKRCEEKARYQEDDGSRYCGKHATTTARDLEESCPQPE